MRKNHHVTPEEKFWWNESIRWTIPSLSTEWLSPLAPDTWLNMDSYPTSLGRVTHVLQIPYNRGINFQAGINDPCGIYLCEEIQDSGELRFLIGDNPNHPGDRMTIGSWNSGLPNGGLFHRRFQFQGDGMMWGNLGAEGDESPPAPSQFWQDRITTLLVGFRGRITFPNGFTIQWDQITAAAGTNHTVTFPVAFGVFFQSYVTSGAVNGIANMISATNTNMVVRSASAGILRWLAIGIIPHGRNPFRNPTPVTQWPMP